MNAPPLSRPRSRLGLVIGVLAVLLAGAMLAALGLGAVRIDVVGILVDSVFGTQTSAGEPWERIILWQVRAPRIWFGSAGCQLSALLLELDLNHAEGFLT